jgi:RHH-type rel operon transcriptional repressor/antitoxin RelB
MLVFHLDDELEKRIADLAYRQGRNKSALVREALIRYMEDQEDIEMAEAVLKNQSGKPTSAYGRRFYEVGDQRRFRFKSR